MRVHVCVCARSSAIASVYVIQRVILIKENKFAHLRGKQTEKEFISWVYSIKAARFEAIHFVFNSPII